MKKMVILLMCLISSTAWLTGCTNNDISLSSLGGNIVFDKLKAENTIGLTAKNENISGAIIGSYDDYSISCDIKKGESNLPSSKESCQAIS